ILITTWPARGSGSGRSAWTRLSRPPNFSKTIARMAVLLFVWQPAGSPASACRDERPPAAGVGGEELPDRDRDLLAMRFQCEMAGVEEADDRTGDVAFERLGTWREEERIVPAPERQEGWVVRSEVLLEGGVQRDVALVVAEQVQLDFIRTGTGQVEVVERIAIGRDRCRVGYAMG